VRPSPRRTPFRPGDERPPLTSSSARCTVIWLYTRAPSSGLTARNSSFCREKSCAPVSTPSASTVLNKGSGGVVRPAGQSAFKPPQPYPSDHTRLAVCPINSILALALE
jgi:hypothetical protein